MLQNSTGTTNPLWAIDIVLVLYTLGALWAWGSWADQWPESWIGVAWSKSFGYVLTALKTRAVSFMERVLVPPLRWATPAWERIFYDRRLADHSLRRGGRKDM
jgi:hypothetical protein